MKKSTQLVILVAALAGVIAFVAIRSFLGPKTSVAATATTTPNASSAADSTPSRAIPEVLPDFTLATLEGPPRALSSFD
ncbi:MAG: hypothetical protein FJ184_11915, partial [Gammaproteobacteria bacterium]|nr:hypothetical protein [Gammaproteobacteria bacterium]